LLAGRPGRQTRGAEHGFPGYFTVASKTRANVDSRAVDFAGDDDGQHQAAIGPFTLAGRRDDAGIVAVRNATRRRRWCRSRWGQRHRGRGRDRLDALLVVKLDRPLPAGIDQDGNRRGRQPARFGVRVD
jgi:hypothetical protein